MSSTPTNCGEPCACVSTTNSVTTQTATVPWLPSRPLTYSQITINLTRQDNTKQQDVLTIDVDPFSDGFYVTFEQKTANARTRALYMADSLKKYLSMYFKALSHAEENYKSVTFNVPLFPCVTQTLEDAQNYLSSNLLPQIQFLIEDWPRI